MRSFRQKMDLPTPGQKAVRRHYRLDYYPSWGEVEAERANILRRWKAGAMHDSDHHLAASLAMDLPTLAKGA